MRRGETRRDEERRVEERETRIEDEEIIKRRQKMSATTKNRSLLEGAGLVIQRLSDQTTKTAMRLAQGTWTADRGRGFKVDGRWWCRWRSEHGSRPSHQMPSMANVDVSRAPMRRVSYQACRGQSPCRGRDDERASSQSSVLFARRRPRLLLALAEPARLVLLKSILLNAQGKPDARRATDRGGA